MVTDKSNDEESFIVMYLQDFIEQYWFTRVLFSIRSASEVFVKHTEAAFADIPDITIADDFTIVTVSPKTILNGTFSITRNTDLKY